MKHEHNTLNEKHTQLQTDYNDLCNQNKYLDDNLIIQQIKTILLFKILFCRELYNKNLELSGIENEKSQLKKEYNSLNLKYTALDESLNDLSKKNK